MRRLLFVLAATAAAILLPATAALAGSAHFVGDPTAVRVDDSLTVSGKIAGLGDEPQVTIVVTATASCINPGSNKPQAANKESLSAAGDFPVQSGRAYFTLTVTAVFQPSCSPPMTTVFSDVVVNDETSGISVAVPGTF